MQLLATGRAPFTQGLGLENINVVTQRGFVPVNERMQDTDANGNLVPHLYCIGDANGKMMLAHAASAHGISVVENICGTDNVLNHLSIPAACFIHPEISMVGLTEPQTREKGEKEGFEISIAKTSFKANTKALAENEREGLAKLDIFYMKEWFSFWLLLPQHHSQLDAGFALAFPHHPPAICQCLWGYPKVAKLVEVKVQLSARGVRGSRRAC